MAEDKSLSTSKVNELISSIVENWKDEVDRKIDYKTRGSLIGQALKNRVIPEETRKNMNQANLGRARAEEHKKKIGLSNLGKKRTEEYRKASSLARTGVPLSEEHKKKIREGQANGNMVGRSVSIDGFIYRTAAEAARKLNLSYLTVYNRIKNPSEKWKNWVFISEDPRKKST